jgi:hypothetical protein
MCSVLFSENLKTTSLNSIKGLVFVMWKQHVFCEVGSVIWFSSQSVFRVNICKTKISTSVEFCRAEVRWGNNRFRSVCVCVCVRGACIEFRPGLRRVGRTKPYLSHFVSWGATEQWPNSLQTLFNGDVELVEASWKVDQQTSCPDW